jgi:excisionase family DNA binding protein
VPKMPRNLDRMLYSPSEVAQLIGFGRTRTYELVREGRIPSIKIDGRTRVRRGDLEAWIEAEASQS